MFHLSSLQYAGWLGPGLCLVRPVIGETFSHGALANRLEVWVDGSPLLIERLNGRWRAGLYRAAAMGGNNAVSTRRTRDALERRTRKLTPLANYAGATPTDGLLTVNIFK